MEKKIQDCNSPVERCIARSSSATTLLRYLRGFFSSKNGELSTAMLDSSVATLQGLMAQEKIYQRNVVKVASQCYKKLPIFIYNFMQF